tara:strand:+ start:1249 stop:1854 length:606 start_codon:yes stop_codon:yes gene_type:complete
MSCGPSKAMKAAADQVDALNAKIDAAIMDIPGMDELANLKENAESAAQGLMDKLSAAIPSIAFPEVPAAAKSLQDEMKEVAGLIALGVLALPQLKNQLDYMKDKYAGVDEVDIDNLAGLLRSGAMDLDSICKLVPNVQTQGINAKVLGIPTSIPDIDPVALIRGGKLPELPKVGKVYVEVDKVSKKQGADFFDIELPNFDF